MFKSETASDREQELKLKYPQKVRFAGSKSPQVKKVSEINNNKKGNPNLLIPVEGLWANGFVLNYYLEIEYLLVCAEDIVTSEAHQMMEALIARAPLFYLVSKKTMDAVSESGNTAGIITLCRFPKKTLADLALKKNNLVVVMDGLEIPGNVGTITRSSDGTDVDAIIVCNKKTRLTHPKFIRSSQGSCFKVPMVESDFEPLLAWLKKHRFRILLTDTEGSVPYYAHDFQGNVAIVMGSERYGISRAWYDQAYEAINIPMFGDCDSLNVGIAATVILYEAALKRKGLLKR